MLGSGGVQVVRSRRVSVPGPRSAPASERAVRDSTSAASSDRSCGRHDVRSRPSRHGFACSSASPSRSQRSRRVRRHHHPALLRGNRQQILIRHRHQQRDVDHRSHVEPALPELCGDGAGACRPPATLAWPCRPGGLPGEQVLRVPTPRARLPPPSRRQRSRRRSPPGGVIYGWCTDALAPRAGRLRRAVSVPMQCSSVR